METRHAASGALQRSLIAALGIGLLTLTYFGAYAFLGYTSDAYLRSDLIRVAPEVSGPVAEVHVFDNQHVEAGATLLTIDPTPYELAVATKRDRVASAQASVASKAQAQASQVAKIDGAEAAVNLAQSEDQRVADLAGRGFASQQELDRARDTLRTSQSALAFARAEALVVTREVEGAQRDVVSAQAELAEAEYHLSRTRITSPAAGYVNNFDVRPGHFASVGEALVGVIDDGQWRVIANFKEDVAASITPQTAVWVWLDTQPWHLYRGHVRSVARGIARGEDPGRLLPYVAPTTDWVRLRRRFPVTITLDPPISHEVLYMGADARVLFWR